MKVTHSLLPKSQAELVVEIDVEEMQPYVQKAAQRISKEVNIKGFRPGKVPYDILKQHVGEATIYEEAFNEAVDATFPGAVEQEKLMVVGRPQVSAEKIAPGNPVVYKAIVPLLPKVTLGDYRSLKTRKADVVLDEKKYQKTLEDLRRMRASEVLVAREAKNADRVVVDFEVKVGGVAIDGGSAQNQSILIGENRFIPGFEEAIVGLKKGEEKTVELTFPEKYKKELAGKKGSFRISLKDVYEVTLAELTDEFAKGLNFDSLQQLQDEIKKNILKELEQAEQEKFENEAIKEIIDLSTFDEIPDQLIDEEVNKIVRELQHDITQQGLKFEDYLTHLKKTEDELRAGFREPAEKRLKAALVMREVAVAEAITVDAVEVDREIAEMKKAYAHMPDAATQIESPAQRGQIENMLFHKKTFEKLEGYTKK